MSKSDEYYTPRYAVDIIVPFLKAKGFRHIWCPFDKEHSQFVQVLRAEGFQVIAGHIETGQDFFRYPEAPRGTDAIVSNPPFSRRDDLFPRLYELGLPFAMVMSLNGLFDSKVRYELFKDKPFELLVPRGRMSFYNEQNEKLPAPNFQSGYVCNGILPEKIIFTEMMKE